MLYYIHKWLLVIMECYSYVLYYIHKWLLVMQCYSHVLYYIHKWLLVMQCYIISLNRDLSTLCDHERSQTSFSSLWI